jgi:hypothetical protein
MAEIRTIPLVIPNEFIKITKIDETDPDNIYIGISVSGTGDNDPNWSIKKISIIGFETSILRVNDGNFNQIWDDRTILIYE